MANPEGGVLPLYEGAVYLTVAKRAVYRSAQKGEISVFKLGGARRFRRFEHIAGFAASINLSVRQAMAARERV